MDYYWWLKFLRRYPTLLLAPIPHILSIHQPLYTITQRTELPRDYVGVGENIRADIKELALVPPIPPPRTPEEELKLLEGYKKLLEEELTEIQHELMHVDNRIKELKKIIGDKR